MNIVKQEELKGEAWFILALLEYKDSDGNYGMYVPFIAYNGEDFIFTPWDWQAFDENCTAEEVCDIEWRVNDTDHKAIIMDGLPRVLTL